MHNTLISYDTVQGEGPAVAVSPTSPLPVTNTGYVSSATDTRPADTTAYAALDVVGNSTPAVLTFANIGPSGGGKVLLTNLQHEIDISSIPSGMTYFRLHLYGTQPTAIADNSAFDLPSGDRAKYLGFIEIPVAVLLGSTVYAETETMNYAFRKEVLVPAGTLYGILQTVGAFTPGSATVRKLTLSGIGV